MSGDSDAPQVGSARSDSTRVLKVNRRKTNRHKTRPYCVYISHVFYCTEYKMYAYLSTVISITKEHTNMKNCLPVHNARLVQIFHSQNNLCCIELCLVLMERPIPGQQRIKSTYLLPSTPLGTTQSPAESYTAVSNSYKYPNSFTHHSKLRCRKASR